MAEAGAQSISSQRGLLSSLVRTFLDTRATHRQGGAGRGGAGQGGAGGGRLGRVGRGKVRLGRAQQEAV